VAGGVDADLVGIVYGTFFFFEGQEKTATRWRRSIRSRSDSTRNRRCRTCRSSRSRTSYELRLGETEKLTSYGWVDKEGGIARIPIDRAMEVMLQRGFRRAPTAAMR
jgi:hypothetical protein